MEKIARKLTDLVGNTPLLELSNYNTSNDLKARLIVKIESFNPAGSVKDRIALAMIEDAETKGILHPGFFANQSYLKTWKESLLILLSVVSDSGRLLPTDNMGKRM